jgi:uncharacterized protein (DUF2147 family)
MFLSIASTIALALAIAGGARPVLSTGSDLADAVQALMGTVAGAKSRAEPEGRSGHSGLGSQSSSFTWQIAQVRDSTDARPQHATARETSSQTGPVPAQPPPAARSKMTPAPAAPASSVLGEWLVEGGFARIAIQPCGAAVCGAVSWSQEGGEVGTQILRQMKPTGPNRWEGTIYDPQSGRTYQSIITLQSPSTLRVEGCVLGFLCGGQTWTRAK